MSNDNQPAKVGSSEGLGPDVTAWVCEYISGEVFVSLAQYPMNDPDVRKAWRLLTLAQRDAQVAAAVAAERERCAKLVEAMDTTVHDGYIETAGDLCEALAARIRRA